MHPLDVKYKAIVHYSHFCRSLRTVARLYGVGKSTLQRWVRGKCSSSSETKANRPKHTRQFLLNAVRNALEENPFCTISTIVKHLKTNCGVVLSPSTVSRSIKAVGFTKKKAFRTSAAPHDEQRVLQFCRDYQNNRDDVVCIDEAGFYVGDHPTRGYAPKGRRLHVASNPSLRRRKLTLIMAVERSGVVHYDISEENCNKSRFIAFVKSLPSASGTVLLMDNVAFHHSSESKQALRAKGYSALFIPPYSPRLNAIENVFSVLKRCYRANCPTSFDTSFDYASLLLSSIECFGSCSQFFDRVDRLVGDTLANGARAFCGVDG